MLVKKGTLCKATCCGEKPYRAGFDFTPKEEPLVSDGIVYLRGKCFACLFRQEIMPELKKHGIVTHNHGGQ